MTIETTTTIGGLNPALPGGTDEIKEGDDHIRLLKSVLQADAASLSKATPQTFAGPVNFAQNVGITGNIAVTGNIVGNAKVTGVQTLENVAPELRFAETDQTDPNGRFRFLGNGNTFALQKALTAGWASNEQIWAYTANALQISKDAIFAAGARIENTTPDLRFADTSVTDPLGRYRINVLGDAIHLQRALTANWATSVDIWNYTHATATLTVPGAATFAGATTFAGAATFTGVPRITANSANLQFLEADAVSPAGQFSLGGLASGGFYFQRYTGPNFTTATNIWRYDNTLDMLTFYVPIANTITIDGASATLRFHESDQVMPNGQYGLIGNGNAFTLYQYTADNWSTPVVIWQHLAAINKLNVVPDLVTTGNFPALEFDSSTAASPAGHYRFQLIVGAFEFQRALTFNFATNDPIWQHRESTDTLNIFKGVSISGVVGASTAGLKLDASYPSIWFADSTPSGSYANMMISGGNSNLRFSECDTNGVLGTTFMWASPLEVSTQPITKLATVANIVEIGSASGSQINFKRSTSVNYITVPDATTFRITNVSAVAWASVNSASGWAAGTSDIRLKENVADIHYGLDTVMALRPIQFDWIAEKRHDIGFSAQDVEKIIPEIVEVWEADPDIEGQIDTYALRKDALTAVLIKAVQELTQRVVALEGTPA